MYIKSEMILRRYLKRKRRTIFPVDLDLSVNVLGAKLDCSKTVEGRSPCRFAVVIYYNAGPAFPSISVFIQIQTKNYDRKSKQNNSARWSKYRI